MRRFVKYLNNNHVTITLFQILLCTIIFLLRENVPISSQAITYTNLTAACILIILLYHAAHKKLFRWSYILCILSATFVFNRLYDKTTFFEVFQFELHLFLILAGCVAGVIIAYPYIKLSICFLYAVLSRFLDQWARDRTDEEMKRKMKHKSRKTVQHAQPTPEFNSSIQDKPEGAKNADQIELFPRTNQAETSSSRSKQTAPSTHPQPSESGQRPLLVLISFLVLLVTTILLLFPALFSQRNNLAEKFTLENLFPTVLSLAAILVILMFIAGLIVALIIKWIHIITDILYNRQSGNLYFLYACGLFLVSYTIYSHYALTVDNTADILLEGKLFSFPLLFSILVPIFLIFTENIISFFKNPHHFLQKCTKQTAEIAEKTVKALLNFIEFVTADYLSTIIELTEEEDDDDKST